MYFQSIFWMSLIAHRFHYEKVGDVTLASPIYFRY